MNQDKGNTEPEGKKKKSPAQKRAEAQADREEWSQERIDAAFAASGGIPKGHPEDRPAEKPHRPIGRPTLIDDIDLEWVQRLAAGGLTKAEIAEAVGIGRSTLMAYQAEYPDFLDAINRGRARDITEIENAVHRAAKGYTFMEEKLQYDTQVGKWARETAVKHCPPDIKAALAILLHSETGSWKSKTETELKFPEPLVIKSLATGQPIESLGLESPDKK